VRALQYGAIEFVRKPTLGVRGFLDDAAATLVDMVRAAAGSRRKQAQRPGDSDKHAVRVNADALLAPPGRYQSVPTATTPIIAVAASTGGTVALQQVLAQMPIDCPGIVVVQHMPAGFTAAFAQRLDETCRIHVSEARDGDRLKAGRALIAPGNYHLIVVRLKEDYFVRVRTGPAVCRHRPSADVLFRSVAVAAGPRAVGVIMTGMGDDGAEGLREMRDAGAMTIAQDAASCVVFGMPKEAIERGAVQTVVPLGRIASEVLKSITSMEERS
jgi:two-component system chemotaxis response regulator CheB